MKKLSLILSLLAIFAISTINAQSPAPICKIEAGKCVVTNADSSTTVMDIKDCSTKCTSAASASTKADCAKKCSATKTASATSAKTATAQSVSFLPEVKTEKKSCATKSCCKKGAKGVKASKVAMKE